MSRSSLAAALALAAAVTLASCSTAPGDEPAAEAAGDTTISVDVPGQDEPLVLPEEPERIVALSPDAAIALHELGLTDRLVAVPEVALNPTLNAYADEMSDVPHTLGSGTNPEPEQVASWNPDLVVVTTRHTGEQDASALLRSTGIPVLTLGNGWSSTDEVAENLALIGAATGREEEADALAAEIRDGVAGVRDRGEAAGERPTVAILSNQAHVPFINASDSLASELVTNGGGANVADAVGVRATMPVQPEQLVAADPDHIMLVDVTGKGEESFAALLHNPAVAALPAVSEGRVRLFAGRDVYGLAGRAVVTGSEQVLTWLHPDARE
ncbi:MAG TPA: ABC transporter substrate-binding protein [Actinomycetales bacterium]|nr:ABC transporter substrate-binding protein [Actinomycetales bacterium]